MILLHYEDPEIPVAAHFNYRFCISLIPCPLWNSGRFDEPMVLQFTEINQNRIKNGVFPRPNAYCTQ